jgi:hypothetical protein
MASQVMRIDEFWPGNCAPNFRAFHRLVIPEPDEPTMLSSPFSLRFFASPPSSPSPSSVAPVSARRLPSLSTWWRVLARQRRRHLSMLERERAALEACACEGAALDLRTIELDGQRYGALYRHGELVCLLPGTNDSA